jgi:hypothetical protein
VWATAAVRELRSVACGATTDSNMRIAEVRRHGRRGLRSARARAGANGRYQHTADEEQAILHVQPIAWKRTFNPSDFAKPRYLLFGTNTPWKRVYAHIGTMRSIFGGPLS